MSNELLIEYQTANILYALIFNSTGQVWNGATFEAPLAANWATYDIAMTEAATTGIYRASMPAVAAGVYTVGVRVQAGASPAVGDVVAGTGLIEWDGTAERRALDQVVEGTLSLAQALRVMLAALAGKASGGGSTTITFRDVADAKARITATVDANGNRTAVTLDGS